MGNTRDGRKVEKRREICDAGDADALSSASFRIRFHSHPFTNQPAHSFSLSFSPIVIGSDLVDCLYILLINHEDFSLKS